MCKFRVIAPLYVAVALLAAAGPTFSLAAAPASIPMAPAASPAGVQGRVGHFVLRTNIADGRLVYEDERGHVDPDLKVQVGDTVEITVASTEGAEHDITFPDLNVASKRFSGATGPATLRFVASRAGEFPYFCSVSGHREAGMEGKLIVAGGVATPVSARGDVGGAEPAAAHGSMDGHAMPMPAVYAAPTAVLPARPDAVSVAGDPAAVPPPIGVRPPETIKYRIETDEVTGQLDDGTTFTYWTFDKKVPGPMLRARVGDTVELTLSNSSTSKMTHSIDLHAVTGAMGGGADTQVAPGQQKTITFKAMHPGLFVYHCATPLVPEHIAAGMYGMILIEPAGGLPKVDREYYVMQGEMYTSQPFGAHVHQQVDMAKLSAEQPEYYVFNGAVGSLTKTHELVAEVGQTVRIYFGVGGPNKVSSFHIVGGVFDTVYEDGSLSGVKHDVQTTLVPPGAAAIVEMKMRYPGKYMLVDHALTRASKGLVGVLDVSGTPDPAIYHVGSTQ
ncbi:copper-containing nitrite reductase [Trinickia acidisoli]|uniref:copper-containing nitrite reductase n=1 Tax=Trinickia acidisoli TaxID=2767482 RepID=UPI001A8F4469|nr:copper-containing nitrite reductase [Trinickia acidisoli]